MRLKRNDWKSRIPWFVAAMAMMFAIIVLVQTDLANQKSDREFQRQWQPVSQPVPSPEPAGETQQPRNPEPTTIPTTPEPAGPTPAPDVEKRTPSMPGFVEGKVTDDDGVGIQGALVRALLSKEPGAQERRAYTDGSGSFRIVDIPEEPLPILQVEAAGYARVQVPDLPVPLGGPINVGMSSLASLVTYILDSPSTGSIVRPFVGTVDLTLFRFYPEGTSSVSPAVNEPNLPRSGMVPMANRRVPVTDGMYHFQNIEPGEYQVTVKTQRGSAESQLLEIPEGRQIETTVTLGQEVSIEGTVISADSHTSVARATVQFRRVPSAPTTPVDHTVFTDSNGGFLIPSIQVGTYDILAEAIDGTTGSVVNWPVTSESTVQHTTITLARQRPRLEIQVQRADEQPLANGKIAVLAMDNPTAQNYFLETDDQGIAIVADIAPGNYEVAVTAPEDKSRQKTAEIEMRPGQTLRLPIQFRPMTRVAGNAVKGSNPYAGILVFSLRGEIQMDTLVKADDTGGYAIDLEPGEYMVGTPETPASAVATIEQQEEQRLNLDVK